jgi:hypothetical protein
MLGLGEAGTNAGVEIDSNEAVFWKVMKRD